MSKNEPFAPWQCPLCGEKLTGDSTLKCTKGHCFDRAKEGYWHLLPVQSQGQLLGGEGALVQHTCKQNDDDNDCQKQPHCSSRHDLLSLQISVPAEPKPHWGFDCFTTAYLQSYLTFGCPAGMLLLYAELTP